LYTRSTTGKENMKTDKELAALPLSDLLLLAVRDSQESAKTRGYELTPSLVFHAYDEERDVCRVCLAGAVLSRTVGVLRYASLTIYSGPTPTFRERWMRAIDFMRTGRFWSALRALRALRVLRPGFEPYLKRYKALDQAEYEVRHSYLIDLGRAPWQAYEKAARVLKKAGL